MEMQSESLQGLQWNSSALRWNRREWLRWAMVLRCTASEWSCDAWAMRSYESRWQGIEKHRKCIAQPRNAVATECCGIARKGREKNCNGRAKLGEALDLHRTDGLPRQSEDCLAMTGIGRMGYQWK